MSIAKQIINNIRGYCFAAADSGAWVHEYGRAVVGDIEEDEQVGSPEWLATLDSPTLYTFMLEAGGRTLRVMVEDVTARES